jgi:hypothetical protein
MPKSGILFSNLNTNEMKNAIKISLLISYTFLSSCSKYYLYHTDGGKNIHNTTSEYFYEDDTLKIIYDFWDNKGKMSFSIYNKLSIPIFIDWKNSAMIINDNKYAYWVDKEIRKGHSVRYSNSGSSFGNETSIAVKDERVSSMPPHSKMKKTANDKLRKITNPKIDGFKMTFRNFIALSTNEDVKNDSYIDNEFYVIKVEKLKKLPEKNGKDFYTIH